MKEEQDRTPLRTILQNFINHIESLEIQNVEDRYEKEFQELKFFSEILKTSKQYSCSEGEKEVNRKKNRYKDILPFDSSRVILSEYAGVPGSDYINANYIKGASGSPAYIACQGPLPHTVNDFWRMVVECEVQVIVMACNEEEAGKHKCENYWVDREGEEKQFGMVAIRLVKASTVCPDFLVRTMRLKYVSSQLPHVSEERTVCQFHYSTWPDHGVPRLVRPLLDMVRLVRDTQASETLPVLVHCSAGCGRTGTICAIDYVWGLLRAGKLSKHFSLHKLVQDMRKQRIAMVQTKEQYILVHQAVRELFHEQLRMIDSHPYENIDANGMPLVKVEQEPVYASPTIVVPAENNSEEKQDGKEKELEEQIPPLPQKRRGCIAFSKQEKEVENLTEKQRSIVEQSGVGMPHKPRIAKLRALFERSPTTRESRSSHSKQQNCQLVTRSHSLGAVRVKTENQEEQVVVKERCGEGNISDPVLCHASLHVSQRSTVQGPASVRPALPIKRSKSLKVLGSNQHCKLSLAKAVNPITPFYTTDDASSGASATSLKPSANILFCRAEGASNLKPAKKYLTRSKGVRVNESDIDSRRFSKQENKHCVSQTHLDQMTYKGASTVPRRRRSLESVNFEDMTVPDGHGLDCHNVVLQSSRQSQSTNVHASKVLQNSKDYIVSKIKHHVMCDHPENKLQGSDAADNLTLEAQRKVNAIVAGLGIRERRNSFRQAVGTGQEGEVELNRKLRDYETIWPSGNNVASPSGSVQSQESSSSGSYGNVTSGSSSAEGSDLIHSHIQTRKGELGNWQETQHSQNPREDRLQQPDETKCPPVSCGLINRRVSEVKAFPHERLVPKHGMNRYVKADKSDVRLGKSGVQPKHLLRSEVLIPDRTEFHRSQRGTDPKLSTSECPSSRLSSSVDASNNFQSSSQCELTGQIPKSAALWQRKSKNHPNSKSVEFKSRSKQESSSQTAVDQELRIGPWGGMTAVTGKISAKEVFYNYSPASVSYHRNATGLVVSHGPCPRVDNAVLSQCKSVPGVCDAMSRAAEVIAAPFTQPKKQYTKQPVSYGLVAGIQLHRGSRDDLALCPSPSGVTERSGPNAQSRVRRHASVVLLRRSLAEAGRVGPVNSSLSQPPLAVWNSTKPGGGEVLSKENVHFCDQEGVVASGSGSWLQAPGVDVDTVAASISPYHGGFPNQQKSSQPAAIAKKQHYL